MARGEAACWEGWGVKLEMQTPCRNLNGIPVYMNKVKVEVTQSCLTLCNLMDYTVHGLLQARILEYVAISPWCIANLSPITAVYILEWASLIVQLVKNPPAMQETLVLFLGQEDLLEKG